MDVVVHLAKASDYVRRARNPVSVVLLSSSRVASPGSGSSSSVKDETSGSSTGKKEHRSSSAEPQQSCFRFSEAVFCFG